METQATPGTTFDASGTARDLFALSDEQILDIAPEPTAPAPVGQPFLTVQERASEATATRPEIRSAPEGPQVEAASAADPARDKTAPPEMAVPQEPPPWLAAQMKDPWGGEEAREFWDGVQQARSEAAAYRAAIASPEDARALKELYPGGVNEARAAAERARLLDEVDRAYFGAAGNSPEQLSASRTQLAQRMLREDPAAFREMVEAGIKVLQEAAGPQTQAAKTLASAVSQTRDDAGSATTSINTAGAQHAAPQLGNASANEAHVAAYAAFERAANEDLERSVGGAIERTLAQALPSFEQYNTPGQAGSQLYPERSRGNAAPLQRRLAQAVRQDVEKALQGDRQLGEQVAQILSLRRFDNEARAQIVRLIGECAQQLVPSAAKRVLNEWTRTTLAAHRAQTQRHDAATTRREVALASPEPRRAPLPARPNDSTRATRRQDASATNARRVDYRKFSDEQILDMS